MTEAIHRQVFSKVGRMATLDEIQKWGSIDLSKEEEITKITRSYDSFLPVDSKVCIIMDLWSKNLFRRPSWKELRDALSSDLKELEDKMKKGDEYKHLRNCIADFKKDLSTKEKRFGKKYRYYGPIGSTGYSKICMEIVKSLSLQGIDLEFVPCSVQEYIQGSGPPDIASITLDNPSEACDLVIIHSTPELWLPIVKREKNLGSTSFYGITVWESDAIPQNWIPYMYSVDLVSTPNKWNAETIMKQCPGVIVDPVNHPVSFLTKDHIPSDVYRFYTINHFSNRKGLYETIIAYLRAFKEEKVSFFLKTSGVDKEKVEAFIEKKKTEYGSKADITVDNGKWSDEQIADLHANSDCFVSLCKAEGHGLGLCQAVLHKNNVIVTGYGGQTDYLKDVDFLSYDIVPATMCTVYEPSHLECQSLPCCRNFTNFIPSQQNWAEPSIEDAIIKMRKSYEERKRGSDVSYENIRRFNFENVGKNFLESFSKITKVDRVVKENIWDLEDKSFYPMSRYLSFPKKKILFIGDYLTGNVGDASYYEIWKRSVNKDIYETYDCPVNFYLREDGQLVSLRDTGKMMDIDYLVYGGGGLIRENDDLKKSSLLQIYFPYCKKRSIDIAILSIGLQWNPATGNKINLEGWKELLNYASVISVRSIDDYSLLFPILEPKRRHRLKVYSDVCYSLPSVLQLEQKKEKKGLLYIPTNFMSIRFADVRNYINSRISSDQDITFIPFDGVNGRYPTNETETEISLMKKYYPGAKVYKGRNIDQRLDKTKREFDISLEEIYDFLRGAKDVVTGRYHGLIFGKVFGCNVYTGHSNTAKMISELESPLDIKTSSGHIDLLREYLRRPNKKDIDDWTEDDRNSAIIKYSIDKSVEVSFVQCLTNKQLDAYI